GNGSAAAAADSGGSGAAAAGGNLQPGEWEMKMEVVNVKVEGLPDGVADQMKSQGGGINRTCMTPEEARAPKGDIFTGEKAANCKSEGFKWEGGRIQGRTVCAGEGGAGQTVMTMDGRYTPQSIDMTMKSQSDLMGKGMTMEMRMSGRRVGECTAETGAG
ncbi:MAG: DUF3617 domain-containing protein, partial [Allosphingosinicella sp.]